MSSVQKQQIDQLKKSQREMTERFDRFEKQMLEQIGDITQKFDLCLSQNIKEKSDQNQHQLLQSKLQSLEREFEYLKDAQAELIEAKVLSEEPKVIEEPTQNSEKQEQNYQSICQINKKLLDNDQLFEENNNKIETKFRTIQNKLGQKLLQGGYSTISDMLNALFIQQQHNIQRLQELDLLVGTQPINNLTITENLKQNQLSLDDFSKKIEQARQEFQKQFDSIENKVPQFIRDLYSLAEKVFKGAEGDYKLFRQSIVGQYEKYQRDRNQFVYTKGDLTVGVEDHSVYIEKTSSTTFDVRFVYNIQSKRTSIFYDYAPRVQKTYNCENLPTDGIIGGGKYNEPIFKSSEKVTLKNLKFNGCIFHGQFRFEHCELSNCQVIGIPKLNQKHENSYLATLQFVDGCSLNKCKISDEVGEIKQYFDSLYFQTCDLTKCQIESVHGILIDAFDYQQKQTDLRFIKECQIKLNADILGLDSEYKKITIQGDKNNFGLQLENSRITVIDSSTKQSSAQKCKLTSDAQIIFTGTRIFIKDCYIEIVDSQGQPSVCGRLQYQFTTTEYSGSIQDSIIKVYTFEMNCVNATGPYKFNIVSSNIITHSQLVSNNYNIDTCIVYNL